MSTLGTASGGKVLQAHSAEDTTVTAIAKTVNVDDTLPQRTETGDVFSIVFTPLSASSNLFFDVNLPMVSPPTASSVLVALYVDGTASAIATASQTINTGWNACMSIKFGPIASGSTSARTYVLAVGNTAGYTVTVNGVAGSRLYGGAMKSTITITETS